MSTDYPSTTQRSRSKSRRDMSALTRWQVWRDGRGQHHPGNGVGQAVCSIRFHRRATVRCARVRAGALYDRRRQSWGRQV